MRSMFAICLASVLPWAVDSVSADTVSIPPSADTCLFEFNSDYNFGHQETFPAGTLGIMSDSALSRGLFKFDIAGAVPAGSTISAASVTLRVESQPSGAANSVFVLYAVFQDWGEGTGEGVMPGGRPAVEGEATWESRFHGSASWDEPGGEIGGDISEDASAMRFVGGPGAYVFDFNALGLADIQGMLDTPDSNFGWALVSLSEHISFTAKRWTSREHAQPPMLSITFTPPTPPEPPEVVAFALDFQAGMGTLAFVRAPDLTHRLEHNPTLVEAEWTMVAELPPMVQQAEGIFEFAFDVENHGFWRIVATDSGPP